VGRQNGFLRRFEQQVNVKKFSGPHRQIPTVGVGRNLRDVDYRGKKLGGFMDWMQLIEIMSSIALVVVTVGLLVLPNMYRKATEEMAIIQQKQHG
jgi:hypothetical protein